MPYSDFNGHLIPSQIPMSALIGGEYPSCKIRSTTETMLGPLAGGPYAPGDTTPRSTMRKYFDEICPKTIVLDKQKARDILGYDYTAKQAIELWLEMLKEVYSESCVEIDDNIFDIW